MIKVFTVAAPRTARAVSVCRVLTSLVLALLACCIARVAHAAPIDLHGQWYEVGAQYVPGPQPLRDQARAVDVLSRTRGRYVYQAELQVPDTAIYVIDFKNSSVIGTFTHRLYDAQGKLVATRDGGIQSSTPNPFFLRHGRDVSLTRGSYRLVSELSSPFLLAQPEPYLDDLRSYQQAIKPGNALVLLGLGVFLGLGLYYAALALARRNLADAMYAAFITGNLLYNGMALLALPELFGVRWFYLISVPILFSNIAYVLFVMALLELRRDSHPRLFTLGLLLLGVLVSFAVMGLTFPHWSLELDRYGVALFVSYGLVAALVRTIQGHSSARMYLAAVGAFFVLAIAAISLGTIDMRSVYVEHLGLLAVDVEVCLLALVLAHQFSLLHSDRQRAIDRANEHFRIAYSDDLTGLPNRYQLDVALAELPLVGSLTFIDLDGLKLYNDRFGHQRGDELLRSFAQQLSAQLSSDATLFRLSGDEFAVTCATGDLPLIAERIEQAIVALRKEGFEMAGASHGSVHVRENPSRDTLKHIADTRMYEQKRQRRAQPPERKRKLA